jgi:lysozyme
MQTSQRGIELIKEFEGLRLKAYLCPAKVWTVGFGHTTSAGPPIVQPGMTITSKQAEEILKSDLVKYEAGVLKLVKVPLTQGQFDALVSFAFNCGVGALGRSTLLKRVNAKRFGDVPAELMKWTKAKGRELPGLVRRRRAEAALWRAVDEATPVDPDESGTAPELPKPSKTMAKSREGNAALAAGGAAAITAVGEAASHVGTLSDALGRPAVFVLIAIALACAAIWYWRRQRLQEEGA